jgi:superfamily II DNA/RNA helicase
LLHGEQKGQQRAAALAQFNIGKLHALVTSDAFGLGIDYQGVEMVLCLDEAAPTAQAYVARWAGTASRHRSSKLPVVQGWLTGLVNRLTCTWFAGGVA